jgi:hypothetical protein
MACAHSTASRITMQRCLLSVVLTGVVLASGRPSAAQGPLAVYTGLVHTTDLSTGHQFAAQTTTLYIYPGAELLIVPGPPFQPAQVNGGVDIDDLYWQAVAASDSSITWSLVNAGAAGANFASEVILPTYPFNTPTTMNMNAGASMTATIAGGILTFTVTGSVSSPYSASFQSVVTLVTATSGFPFPIPSVPLQFFTLSPCRLVDTRQGVGPLGGPALQAGSVRTFSPIGNCGIPAGAKVLSANVTVVGSATAGDVRAYPGDLLSPPPTSVINFVGGQTRANNTLLKLAADGSGTLKVLLDSSPAAHLILDVNGYFQ